MDVATALAAGHAGAGAHAEERADGERASVGADVDAARVPASGNQPAEVRDVGGFRIEVEYGDGVRSAEGDVEAAPVGRERDRSRRDADAMVLERVDTDRRHDGVGARVDD